MVTRPMYGVKSALVYSILPMTEYTKISDSNPFFIAVTLTFSEELNFKFAWAERHENYHKYTSNMYQSGYNEFIWLFKTLSYWNKQPFWGYSCLVRHTCSCKAEHQITLFMSCENVIFIVSFEKEAYCRYSDISGFNPKDDTLITGWDEGLLHLHRCIRIE